MNRKDIADETICPVCEKHHYEEPAAYEECPVCGWYDDLAQRADKDYDKGYNPVSVNQAKENYRTTGRAFEHLSRQDD